MRDFRKEVWLVLLIASGLGSPFVMAQAPDQTLSQPESTTSSLAGTNSRPPGVVAPAANFATRGRDVLNAGPDPRVRWDGLSREHAAIFGTRNKDEQALRDSERVLRIRQEPLHILEHLLIQKPVAADSPLPAMIPLNAGSSLSMTPLAQAQSSSRLSGSDAQRSVDQMQRRVNQLRRDVDTMQQAGR